jgi:UDP-2,3-diacylglucosamine hydrolase
MNLPKGKKIYFASDFHLGVPNEASSNKREKLICTWLKSIKSDCFELYLVGDVFDFWFEYKEAIPKGFIRIQAAIADFTDSGIRVYYFTGNHDMWAFNYFEKELGLKMFRSPIERNYNNKLFYIGHGDGLGPGDYGYKFIKKVFANKLCQWAFARLHPNFGLGLGNFWSRKSRHATGTSDEIYHGDDKEFLVVYCNEVLKNKYYDYFIFGHRHLVLDIELNNKKSRYFNLGDWIKYNSYGVFDGDNFKIETYHLEQT